MSTTHTLTTRQRVLLLHLVKEELKRVARASMYRAPSAPAEKSRLMCLQTALTTNEGA